MTSETEITERNADDIKNDLDSIKIIVIVMEQVKGIEPSCQPWQGCVLPLNYTCDNGGPDGT